MARDQGLQPTRCGLASFLGVGLLSFHSLGCEGASSPGVNHG